MKPVFTSSIILLIPKSVSRATPLSSIRTLSYEERLDKIQPSAGSGAHRFHIEVNDWPWKTVEVSQALSDLHDLFSWLVSRGSFGFGCWY